MNDDELREKIRDFSNKIVEEDKEYIKNGESPEELRKKFTEEFPRSSLPELTKESYSLGTQNKNPFCWWVEYKTKRLGSISGNVVKKFYLWYSKDNGRYMTIKKYHDDPEKAISDIKENLVSLLKFAENKDLNAIHNIKLSPMFKGKIIYLYFPERYLSVFSEKDVDYFLSILGIQSKNNETLEEKRDILLRWKENNDVMKSEKASNWTVDQFKGFLYNKFKDEYGAIIKSSKDNGISSETCMQRLKHGEGHISGNRMKGLTKLLLFDPTDGVDAIICEFDVKGETLKLFDPNISSESIASVEGLANILHDSGHIFISKYQYEKIISATARDDSEEGTFPRNSEQADKELGKMGEEFVMESEKKKLIESGRKDLAEKVEMVGDRNHYDVKSFEPSGAKKLIEVKTTVKAWWEPFYITQPERNFLEGHQREYFLYRVYEFDKSSKQGKIIFYPPPNALNSLEFLPTMFRCNLKREGKTY